jgi:hypothetical protein
MNNKTLFIILGVIVFAGLVIANPDMPVSEFFMYLLVGIGIFAGISFLGYWQYKRNKEGGK